MSGWTDVIKTVAPTLATALGGPFAGIATKWLAGKVIGDESASEEDVERWVMSANPTQLLELKKADQAFALEMERAGIDLERIAAEDRSSARGMAIATGFGPQIILSVAYTGAYAMVLYLFMSGQVHVSDSHLGLFNTILGILTVAQTQILNFWFGSSAGSKRKTEAMAK